MSDLSMVFYLHNPVQGRAEMVMRALPAIGEQLHAGRQLAVKVVELEEDLTEAQRGYYHRVVLQFIADHAVANGQKFPMPVWKEHFRAKFLGSKRKAHRDPMTGRRVWRTERVSTETLGVRGYSLLIEQVIAFASTELSLTIPAPEQPLPKAERKRQQAMEQGRVDADGVLEVAA